MASFFPGYAAQIANEECRSRYAAKLMTINNLDPYEIPKEDYKDDVDLWPSISCIHVGMYLVFTPSPYTGDDLLNYKSMECYQRFTSGWIRDILVKDVNDKRIVIAKVISMTLVVVQLLFYSFQVNHSMKMREKPLTPWIVAESDGKILVGHCDCMAGLGETCSHVGTLLWAIEAGVRLRDSMTVTQKKAYWVIPPAIKDVPYAKVKNMNFQGKSSSWRQTRSLSKSVSPSPSPAPLPAPKKKRPSEFTEDFNKFLSDLDACSSKPAILSLIPQFSDKFVPKSLAPDFPSPLSNLYNSDYLKLDYQSLLQKASEITIEVTESQARFVEQETRDQYQSRLWYRMRSGRITASKLKAACRTDPCLPSQSLIMSICYPELSKFKSTTTQWGCEHEPVARDKYKAKNCLYHTDLRVEDCGFFISTEFPFIGASPDGLVSCKCCGNGICEIKVAENYL